MKRLPEENVINILIQTLMGSPLLRCCFVLTATALACFGRLPLAQAVSPPPDGGYANFTTAAGQDALFSLSTGAANTAVGAFSLESIAIGSFNTAVGAGALLSNTADSNTAIGTAALLVNTDGDSNTAVGVSALENNTTSGNTAVGSDALLSNTTGGTLNNTLNFDVGPNVAIGLEALKRNTIASGNTAVGYQALGNNTTGIQDTDVGVSTAVGFQALANASGPDAGANDGFGYQTLFNLTSGGSDVAIGVNALHDLTSGDANTAVGAGAGGSLSSGDFNVFIGQDAGSNVISASNVICIGAAGNNVSGSCFIDHIFNSTSSGGVGVFVNSNGRLGTSTSSRRFKEDIKPMGKASEAILALKPVTFHYKRELDAERIPQFGLIAEDVEKVNPDLIVRGKDGKPYSVRYDQVNAMLLNEFLKQHKRVQELEATVAHQQNSFAKQQAQIEILGSRLQTVSNQIEISTTATQMARNNP